jgi:hypothetical protein
MNQDQLYKFVFRVIDRDSDEMISKKDLLLFFSREYNGRKIYSINYLKLIENFDTRRPDQINIVDFNERIAELPFLTYPAQRIQDD